MGRPRRQLGGFGAGARLALLVTLAFATSAALAASAGAAPLLLVGTETESVVAINSQTHAVVGKPIGLGTDPAAIAITPAGQAYIAEPAVDAVAVVDMKTLKFVTTIPTGPEPFYLAVSPDGKTVYVADDGAGANEITVIDTATNAVTGSIAVAGGVLSVAFAPGGAFAYVTTGLGLQTIDTATRTVVGPPVEVGKDPLQVAFSPDGRFAYTANKESEDISVVETAGRRTVATIKVPGSELFGLAVSPDGTRLYVSDREAQGIRVFSTQTLEQVGKTIPTGPQPFEIALTPDGKTLWVSAQGSNAMIPIDTATDTAGASVELPGAQPWQVAITPDLSPTAAFTAPDATPGIPATFSGAASTDPDGTVTGWAWSFGDGGTASGASVTHAYGAAGTFGASLSVIDNEGCGAATLITGRTAFCSGNPAATVTHPVTVTAPAPAPIVCTARLRFGRIVHNRRNGTVRLQVRVPVAGSLYLFGKKVHAVSRRSVKGMTFLTLHPRVEVNKRLKKVHRIPVRYRVTFYPAAGCGGSITAHRSVSLQRAPQKKHRHQG